MKPDALTLAHGLTFADLYDRDGLVRLDGVFLDTLGAADADLERRLVLARRDPGSLARLEESELIMEVAPHLERFLGRLFGFATSCRCCAPSTARWRRSSRSGAISCNAGP